MLSRIRLVVHDERAATAGKAAGGALPSSLFVARSRESAGAR
jgi:hypothetical protein